MPSRLLSDLRPFFILPSPFLCAILFSLKSSVVSLQSVRTADGGLQTVYSSDFFFLVVVFLAADFFLGAASFFGAAAFFLAAAFFFGLASASVSSTSSSASTSSSSSASTGLSTCGARFTRERSFS